MSEENNAGTAVSMSIHPDPAIVANDLADTLKAAGVSDDVIAKIKDELGASTVADLSALTETDLVGVGMKVVPARNLLTGLKASAPASQAANGMINPLGYDDVLPAAPSEESWIKALRAGGVLKVEQSTVVAAVRAAVAQRIGLFTVPNKLVVAMEAFADESEEQVGPEYYRLRKQLTRRSYGDIFEAIDGLDGSFVTEARRTQLLQRIDQILWPAIIAFQNQLKGWQETYLGPGNQAMMMNNVMMSMMGGGVMPGGMLQPPDTSILRTQAEDVNNAANKVFAGTGVQIAAALAYEASKISETLQSERLPALTGAANREQMLRKLGVAVSAAYPRYEASIVRYVLSILNIENVPVGSEEARYFLALYMLGSQIPWDILGTTGGKLTGIGGRGVL